MCGIAGFWSRESKTDAHLVSIGQAMAGAITHRGPDDAGVSTPGNGVVLAHRRLSIIDLSPLGHQPMASASGRLSVVFNGEIYNYKSLKTELQDQGVRFKGGSDTEVILEAFDLWGLEATLGRCDGMFALALWEHDKRKLYLARDRFGEKPLYYTRTSEGFGFASELAALSRVPGFDRSINRGALGLYMRHNYVPAPYSIYSGSHKLPPASILEVTAPDTQSFSAHAFWSAAKVMTSARKRPLGGSDQEITGHLDTELRKAVLSRMVSDVPIGAFLSGGTDSSVIVALMQAQSSQPVKTFTIGFSEAAYDESTQAAAVASHLGTDHTALMVTPRDATDVIPLLPGIYNEPFADASQIPTYLVAKLARSRVTVALSGDAGDEFFGGYNRYFWGRSLWRAMSPVPHALRRLSGKLIGKVSPAAWDSLFRHLGPALPQAFRQPNPGHKVQKIARIMGAKDLGAMYLNLVSAWADPSTAVLGLDEEPPTRLTRTLPGEEIEELDGIERMMYLDTVSYLPDDILTKVDRATMAVGLEARVPLLSPDVFELGWRVPLARKIGQASGKLPLKAVLAKYVPSSITDKPKQGFSMPVADWLRGPLRAWADDLLSPALLRSRGLLDGDTIGQRWREHREGQRNWQDQLWCVLMFQAWQAASC